MKAIAWNPAKQGDPYAYYARLRRQSPVIRARIPTRGPGWVVTRYADAVQVMRDPRFSNDPRNSATPPLFGFGGRFAPKLIKLVGDSMICADNPAHGRLRKLVSKAFTPKSIAEMEGSIAQVVETMLDEAAALEARAGHVDLMTALALPLPLTVISEMLGIPDAWRFSFHHQITRLIEVNDMPVKRAIRWLPAMPKLVAFFERLIDLKRTEPDDRLISRLIAVRDEGDSLSRDELVAMIFLLLFAGHETSVNLIGNGVLALLDHPEQLALLRDRPELMDGAVEELLRYTNPVEYGTMRFATEPVTLAGVTIPKGDLVMALIASANHDETAFAAADTLDVTRTDNRHLALGFGLHYCLGAALGRLETKVALEALLRRFPHLSLAAPRGSIQWRQSSGLRGVVALPVTLGAQAAARPSASASSQPRAPADAR